MKVLFVTNMYPNRNDKFPYAGVFVKEQIDALIKECDVEPEVFIIDGFRSNLLYISSVPKLIFKIISGRFDVVHVHYGLSGLFALFRFFFPRKLKLFMTLHGGDILIAQGKRNQVFLTKMILPFYDKIFLLNEEMAEVVSRYNKNYYRLPCGVSLDFFRPGTLSKKKVIIFPGAPNRPVKNFKLFMSIFDELVKIDPEFSFIALHDMSREQVSEVMRTSALLLLTSISEGSPQVIKEALASDMAIVSTNVGDVQIILDKTEGTFVFELCDGPECIARKLLDVMSTSKLTPGKRRDRIIQLELSNEAVARKIADEYKA